MTFPEQGDSLTVEEADALKRWHFLGWPSLPRERPYREALERALAKLGLEGKHS